MESQGGIPRWKARVESEGGKQRWKAKVESEGGKQRWKAKVESKGGKRRWKIKVGTPVSTARTVAQMTVYGSKKKSKRGAGSALKCRMHADT